MKLKKRIRLNMALLGMIVAACSSSGSNSFETLSITTQSGTHTFQVEIADTPQKRAAGLMDRRDIGKDQGMLFVFPALTTSAFWMKNTPTSLDIIYIDSDGTVLQINRDTVPFSEELIPAEQPYLYTLELLAGTSDRINLAVGDQLTLPEL